MVSAEGEAAVMTLGRDAADLDLSPCKLSQNFPPFNTCKTKADLPRAPARDDVVTVSIVWGSEHLLELTEISAAAPSELSINYTLPRLPVGAQSPYASPHAHYSAHGSR